MKKINGLILFYSVLFQLIYNVEFNTSLFFNSSEYKKTNEGEFLKCINKEQLLLNYSEYSKRICTEINSIHSVNIEKCSHREYFCSHCCPNFSNSDCSKSKCLIKCKDILKHDHNILNRSDNLDLKNNQESKDKPSSKKKKICQLKKEQKEKLKRFKKQKRRELLNALPKIDDKREEVKKQDEKSELKKLKKRREALINSLPKVEEKKKIVENSNKKLHTIIDKILKENISKPKNKHKLNEKQNLFKKLIDNMFNREERKKEKINNKLHKIKNVTKLANNSKRFGIIKTPKYNKTSKDILHTYNKNKTNCDTNETVNNIKGINDKCKDKYIKVSKKKFNRVNNEIKHLTRHKSKNRFNKIKNNKYFKYSKDILNKTYTGNKKITDTEFGDKSKDRKYKPRIVEDIFFNCTDQVAKLSKKMKKILEEKDCSKEITKQFEFGMKENCRDKIYELSEGGKIKVKDHDANNKTIVISKPITGPMTECEDISLKFDNIIKNKIDKCFEDEIQTKKLLNHAVSNICKDQIFQIDKNGLVQKINHDSEKQITKKNIDDNCRDRVLIKESNKLVKKIKRIRKKCDKTNIDCVKCATRNVHSSCVDNIYKKIKNGEFIFNHSENNPKKPATGPNFNCGDKTVKTIHNSFQKKIMRKTTKELKDIFRNNTKINSTIFHIGETSKDIMYGYAKRKIRKIKRSLFKRKEICKHQNAQLKKHLHKIKDSCKDIFKQNQNNSNPEPSSEKEFSEIKATTGPLYDCSDKFVRNVTEKFKKNLINIKKRCKDKTPSNSKLCEFVIKNFKGKLTKKQIKLFKDYMKRKNMRRIKSTFKKSKSKDNKNKFINGPSIDSQDEIVKEQLKYLRKQNKIIKTKKFGKHFQKINLEANLTDNCRDIFINKNEIKKSFRFSNKTSTIQKYKISIENETLKNQQVISGPNEKEIDVLISKELIFKKGNFVKQNTMKPNIKLLKIGTDCNEKLIKKPKIIKYNNIHDSENNTLTHHSDKMYYKNKHDKFLKSEYKFYLPVNGPSEKEQDEILEIPHQEIKEKLGLIKLDTSKCNKNISELIVNLTAKVDEDCSDIFISNSTKNEINILGNKINCDQDNFPKIKLAENGPKETELDILIDQIYDKNRVIRGAKVETKVTQENDSNSRKIDNNCVEKIIKYPKKKKNKRISLKYGINNNFNPFEKNNCIEEKLNNPINGPSETDLDIISNPIKLPTKIHKDYKKQILKHEKQLKESDNCKDYYINLKSNSSSYIVSTKKSNKNGTIEEYIKYKSVNGPPVEAFDEIVNEFKKENKISSNCNNMSINFKPKKIDLNCNDTFSKNDNIIKNLIDHSFRKIHLINLKQNPKKKKINYKNKHSYPLNLKKGDKKQDTLRRIHSTPTSKMSKTQQTNSKNENSTLVLQKPKTKKYYFKKIHSFNDIRNTTIDNMRRNKPKTRKSDPIFRKYIKKKSKNLDQIKHTKNIKRKNKKLDQLKYTSKHPLKHKKPNINKKFNRTNKNSSRYFPKKPENNIHFKWDKVLKKKRKIPDDKLSDKISKQSKNSIPVNGPKEEAKDEIIEYINKNNTEEMRILNHLKTCDSDELFSENDILNNIKSTKIPSDCSDQYLETKYFPRKKLRKIKHDSDCQNEIKNIINIVNGPLEMEDDIIIEDNRNRGINLDFYLLNKTMKNSINSEKQKINKHRQNKIRINCNDLIVLNPKNNTSVSSKTFITKKGKIKTIKYNSKSYNLKAYKSKEGIIKVKKVKLLLNNLNNIKNTTDCDKENSKIESINPPNGPNESALDIIINKRDIKNIHKKKRKNKKLLLNKLEMLSESNCHDYYKRNSTVDSSLCSDLIHDKPISGPDVQQFDIVDSQEDLLKIINKFKLTSNAVFKKVDLECKDKIFDNSKIRKQKEKLLKLLIKNIKDKDCEENSIETSVVSGPTEEDTDSVIVKNNSIEESDKDCDLELKSNQENKVKVDCSDKIYHYKNKFSIDNLEELLIKLKFLNSIIPKS